MSALWMSASLSVQAQSQIYPNHFDLQDVQLLDGPMKSAMEINFNTLLAYDVDRLLTPFIRQAGLHEGRYADWQKKHPNFKNWGGDGFDLSGHIGGHYLSALAMAYAACQDAATKERLQSRLLYMIDVLKDCQNSFDQNTTGLYGFIGGQPINEDWEKLYQGDISGIWQHRGWVPFYCEHKVMAGLRDAYLYAHNQDAKLMLKKMADWCTQLIAKVSDADMQKMLTIEHGGINESMADCYAIFKDIRYLEAAKKYSQREMLEGLQSLNATFLDNRHANTQVPKYIGFERIVEEDPAALQYATAASNFWQDVAHHRTVCIGGNSISEHFLSNTNSNRYIDNLEGPESCNTNNMLKLSEMLSDRTHDAGYADFYEYAMWNHILSTQDPQTGGYVYFTTLRPQGYRIYSVPNQGMWCCVGTGMENHSKYGHFVYTHDGDRTLYVNLFTASKLDGKKFKLTQQTNYPYEPKTTITIEKSGRYAIAIRRPWWTTSDYRIQVNGQTQQLNIPSAGTSAYATLERKWKKGDVITVDIPMTLRQEACPNYEDYIALEYGPILLGAQTTSQNEAEARATGLQVEKLQNEYAGDGRMDHSPGAVGSSKSLISAPMLIGERSEVLRRVKALDLSKLTFTIDASRTDSLIGNYAWKSLTLKPFYSIHHSRYMCYWYQQTLGNYAKSDIAMHEAARQALDARTIDFVATGEQQSEAGHEYKYSDDSNRGNWHGETYRDAQPNGYIQYALYNKEKQKDGLSLLCRFATSDRGRMATLTVDGVKIADIKIPSHVEGAEGIFFNVEYPIPANLLVDAKGKVKEKVAVKLTASSSTPCPGFYYLRLLKSN